MPVHDPVLHPAHYTRGRIEVIDFIDDQQLDFYRATIVQYLVRSPYKGKEIEDLRKALFYLARLIEQKEAAAQ